mgnify:CR=1 FL=1
MTGQCCKEMLVQNWHWSPHWQHCTKNVDCIGLDWIVALFCSTQISILCTKNKNPTVDNKSHQPFVLNKGKRENNVHDSVLKEIIQFIAKMLQASAWCIKTRDVIFSFNETTLRRWDHKDKLNMTCSVTSLNTIWPKHTVWQWVSQCSQVRSSLHSAVTVSACCFHSLRSALFCFDFLHWWLVITFRAMWHWVKIKRRHLPRLSHDPNHCFRPCNLSLQGRSRHMQQSRGGDDCGGLGEGLFWPKKWHLSPWVQKSPGERFARNRFRDTSSSSWCSDPSVDGSTQRVGSTSSMCSLTRAQMFDSASSLVIWFVTSIHSNWVTQFGWCCQFYVDMSCKKLLVLFWVSLRLPICSTMLEEKATPLCTSVFAHTKQNLAFCDLPQCSVSVDALAHMLFWCWKSCAKPCRISAGAAAKHPPWAPDFEVLTEASLADAPFPLVARTKHLLFSESALLCSRLGTTIEVAQICHFRGQRICQQSVNSNNWWLGKRSEMKTEAIKRLRWSRIDVDDRWRYERSAKATVLVVQFLSGIIKEIRTSVPLLFKPISAFLSES